MNRLASPFIGARAGGRYAYKDVGVGYMTRLYVGADIWRLSISAAWDFHEMKYSDVSRSSTGWLFSIAYNF